MRLVNTFLIAVSVAFGLSTQSWADGITPGINLPPRTDSPRLTVPDLRFRDFRYIDGCNAEPPRRNILIYNLVGEDIDQVHQIQAYQVRPGSTPLLLEMIKGNRGRPNSLVFRPLSTASTLDVRPRYSDVLRFTMIARNERGDALASTQTTAPLETTPLNAVLRTERGNNLRLEFIELNGRRDFFWVVDGFAKNVELRNVSGNRIFQGRPAWILPRVTFTRGLDSATSINRIGNEEIPVTFAVEYRNVDGRTGTLAVTLEMFATNPSYETCLYWDETFDRNMNLTLTKPNRLPPSTPPPPPEPEMPLGEWVGITCLCSNANTEEPVLVPLRACLYTEAATPATGAGAVCGTAAAQISQRLRLRTSCAFSYSHSSYGGSCVPSNINFSYE